MTTPAPCRKNNLINARVTGPVLCLTCPDLHWPAFFLSASPRIFPWREDWLCAPVTQAALVRLDPLQTLNHLKIKLMEVPNIYVYVSLEIDGALSANDGSNSENLSGHRESLGIIPASGWSASAKFSSCVMFTLSGSRISAARELRVKQGHVMGTRRTAKLKRRKV